MPQLAVHRDFVESFHRLQPPVRDAVFAAIERFGEHTHAGLHLEKLQQAKDPRWRTIRITDYWRGVVVAPDHGDRYLLWKVLGHDEALAFIRDNRVTVNARTGVVEVRNETALETIAPALEQAALATSDRLFAHVRDKQLIHLGIDEELLPLVRDLTAETELEALQPLLPANQYDVLLGLAAGMTVEEVWEQTAADLGGGRQQPGDVDTSDLGAAMERTPGQVLLVSGPQELLAELAKPFAAWRTFLHPSQRRIAYRPSYSGPAQVTGGPGTGKTVVALHRVRHLLSRPTGGRHILLTTFTNALAQSLRDNLALLVDPDDLPRVQVTTVDALANRVVRESRGGTPLRIAGERTIEETWQEVIARRALPWTPSFLGLEYQQVILAQDIRSLDAYLAADRRSRGSRLGPEQRRSLWRGVEVFEHLLRERGEWTYTQVCAEAARILAGRPEPPYAHVVVDEAQDLHPAQWRVLRACVAEGPDDLFIAADPHQRIYAPVVSLRTLGIRVTGRSQRLRLNYRSTDEILRWATAVLTGAPVTALADGDPDTLDGYHATLHGRPPETCAASDSDAELDALVRWVGARLDEGVDPADIGVAARFTNVLRKAVQRLQAAGIPAAQLAGQRTPADGCVRLGTMHAMKGLEFRCMAVVGVTADAVPPARALTPVEVDAVQHATDLLRERCLLFVACTRAREALYVSWHGAASPFVPR